MSTTLCSLWPNKDEWGGSDKRVCGATRAPGSILGTSIVSSPNTGDCDNPPAVPQVTPREAPVALYWPRHLLVTRVKNINEED
ncbi:hypothetical protein E2C01_080860 [Portunus trituberculatus]|uniref:Uncharacterized protein n=1 Tax=Portunus trituberculatus TaxID=210409 RepID=A0A5B7IZH2_PORTR|nr:hypothetical protein [Portunus trituberculatus]